MKTSQRRTRSVEERQHLVREWQTAKAQGETMTAFAARNNVTQAQMYAWLRRFSFGTENPSIARQAQSGIMYSGQDIKTLQTENANLKMIVGDLTLTNRRLAKSIA